MLLTRQKREAHRPQLNMASMIDVVFLLLIFFMCTSSFAKPESNLPTQLPQVGTAAAAEDQLDPVRIRVGRTGKTILIACDGQTCTTLSHLSKLLKARRALGEPVVVIEGQGSVPFGTMVAVLDTCYAADLWQVAFSAKGAGP